MTPPDQPCYLITSEGCDLCCGTIAQINDTFGLCVDATEEDVIAFVRTSRMFPQMELFKRIALSGAA